MKNLISILLSMALVMGIAGCGDSQEKETSNKASNEVSNVLEDKDESKEQEEKIPTLTLDVTYGNMENIYNGRSLNEISLKSDGTYEESSCAAEGGCTRLRGTYVIDKTKLTLTAKEVNYLFEWEAVTGDASETFTITEDNAFKADEKGIVYKLYN